MKHQYSLSTVDPGKVLWLQNFGLKLPVYTIPPGISSSSEIGKWGNERN